MIDLPPDVPAFCIKDLQRVGDSDRYNLHIVSFWTDDGPTEVSEDTVDFVTDKMVWCPTGYPNPPQ
jgi:hypothetical protein